MRSSCPIPFAQVFGNWKKSIKNKGKYVYPIYFACSKTIYSPMCFSLEFLNDNKRYLVEGIYSNVEFSNKGSRFCYA